MVGENGLTANDDGMTTLADRRSGTEASLVGPGTHIWLSYQHGAGAGESEEVFCTIVHLTVYVQ